MANYPKPQANHPLILLVPGYPDGGPSDWMKAWERQRSDCRRLDLGLWEKPHRNTWVNKLNLAIHRAGRPVVLVAHDIACLAAVWWAEYEQPEFGDPVVGALLVAPPDVDRPGADPRLPPFGACPRQPLPFPCFVVADRKAATAALVTATQLGHDWGGCAVLDSIDAHGWRSGEHLLRRLLREHQPTVRPPVPPKVDRRPVRELVHA
jgi:predicted alpha/beta hydrolase family esterase